VSGDLEKRQGKTSREKKKRQSKSGSRIDGMKRRMVSMTAGGKN